MTEPSRLRWRWWAVVTALTMTGLILGPQLGTNLASASGTTTTSASSSTTTSTTSPTSTSTTSTAPPGSTTTSSTSTTTTTSPVARRITSLVWPKMGSAAWEIPQLNAAASSPYQPEVPIASLTKLMTMWIVLHKFPLANSGLGACENVSTQDFALYLHDVAQGQSVVQISLGQRICERTLLRGIIVHSAGDYAQLLARFIDVSPHQFVVMMNRQAAALGMRHTHYADETGISSSDVSTASDQVKITVALMTTEPIIPRIAKLAKVWLPVQGVVGTYTPDLGFDGVAGVKSGYTEAAGGCDAMAVNLRLNTTMITTYIVVLGQKSENALALSGNVALALYRSIRPSVARVRTSNIVQVEWIGSLGDVVTANSRTSNTTSDGTRHS